MNIFGALPFKKYHGTQEALIARGIATERAFAFTEADGGFKLFTDQYGNECSIIRSPTRPDEYEVTQYGPADDATARLLSNGSPDDVDVSEILNR